MKIDSTELLDEIKESSIKNLIETFNSIKNAWYLTTKNYPFSMKMPILLIPIVFNKYDEESFSFFFLTPHILQEEGIYSLEIYPDVADIVKRIPDILSYAILGEEENSYFIEYEDLRECITIKLRDQEGLLIEESREKPTRIAILSFPDSSVPN